LVQRKMTPKTYFDEICRPALQDFIENPTSLRHAYCAVTNLYHLQDWIARFRGVKISDVREELQRDFPNIQALADIANASKHFELDRGPRKGLRASDLRTGSGAAFDDGTYFDDGTSFANIPDVIRIEFNGDLIDVLHLCKTAAAFLETKI
jgi:hypothetical protein